MKRTVYCLLSIALVASVIAVCAPKAAPVVKPIVLSCVSFFPRPDVPMMHGWWRLRELINERAKGELILEYKGGPEVMPIVEATEAVRKGVLDMVLSSGPYVAGVVPEALSLGLTKIHPHEQRKTGYYDLMNDILKTKMNVFYLGRVGFFTYSMYTVKRIDKLADLSGRKFRVVPTYEPFYKKLGIVGVSMPMGEAYTALERGLVEGITNPKESVRDLKWCEILRYKLGPDFWFTETFFAVNLDKWNKLPKHLQDLMKKTAEEVEGITWKYHPELEEKIWADLEKSGMKKFELSPADTERFLDLVYSANWEWIEGKVGREVTAKLKAAAGK